MGYNCMIQGKIDYSDFARNFETRQGDTLRGGTSCLLVASHVPICNKGIFDQRRKKVK